jgi:glycosyltransferase involved in cell wall biosynthesis
MIKSMPMVSIITPFLNTEKFIEEAIESVLNQTYHHWQLLLIDDGSTDGSTLIAKRYAKEYPDKILYFEHDEHKNLGKSISRNLGIRHASGKYIALLDADDVYLPQKLERQVAILEAHPNATLVYGPTQYWYSWTNNVEDMQRDFVARLGVEPDALFYPPTLLTQFLRDGRTVPCTCGLLARREVVENIGGFEESIQDLYEDQVFLVKICLAGPVYVESGCWDRYRRHQESSWQVAINTGRESSTRLIFLKWLEAYLLQKDLKDTDAWRALKKQFLPYQHPYLYHFAKRAWFLAGRMKGSVKVIAQRIRFTG